MAKGLMREKLEAESAALRLFASLQSLRDQQVQWTEEKEVLTAKVRALDEDKATLVVPPPSEGVWFARSGEQQQIEEPRSQSASSRSTVGLDVPKTQGTQRLAGQGLMKGRLGSLDEAPLISEIRVTPPETAPPNPPLSGSLRRHFLKWPRIPANPPRKPGPCSTRWRSGAPQVDPSQLGLVDVGSQIVGIDQSTYRPSSVDLDNREDQGTQGLEGSLDETRLIPEIRITPPESSGADSGSMANATALANGSNQYLSPNSCLLLHRRPRRRSRERNNPTPKHPRCIPVMQRTLPPKAPLSASSRRTFNITLDQPQCIPVMQPTFPPKTPLSASSRRPSFTSPGLPGIAADPLPRLVSRPSRWFSAAPQVGPSQLDLIDLGSQIVGRDPSSESCGRQVMHDRWKSLQPLGNAFGIEDNCPPINFATEAELEARMKTVSSEAKRPRGTIRNDPQIHIFPKASLASPSEIGGERRGFFSSLGRLGTPWRRSTSDGRFATVEQQATLESPRKRGPFGIFTRSSSPRGTTPEEAGDPQPKQKSRLRTLLKKGRCLISRVE